jgi:hypothetical protein
VIGWDRGIGLDLSDAEGGWSRDLPGTRLRVSDQDRDEQTDDDPDDLDDLPEDMEKADREADQTLLPWVWRVSRVVDRFTEIELESGRKATFDEAVIAAEDAAGRWR